MRKISVMLLFVCTVLMVRAQEVKYTIKGKTTPGSGDLQLHRYDLANGQRTDILKVDANGNFTITGTVPDIQIGQITGGQESHGAVFYLEDGVINIDMNEGHRYPILSGTPLNNDFNDYYVAFGHMVDSAEANNHTGKPYNVFYDLKPERLQLMEKFALSHPNSLLTLFELDNNVAKYPEEVSDLARIYNELSPEIRKTKAGKDMATHIKGLGSGKIGDQALDFAMPDPNGKIVKLTDFRGKYVLLDFWATWCEPCLEEMPNVINAYQKYHGKDFDIIGVSLDRPDGKELWKKMIVEKHMDWTHVCDLKWWNSQAALLYNVQGVPANFLIDPNGKIIGKDLRGPDLQQKLAEIFKQ